MARTQVRARPGGRPSKSRSAWQAVGRKRQGPSPVTLAVAWLTRLETGGLWLLAITLALSVWVAAGRSAGPLDSIVDTFGLLTYVFAVLLGIVGVLIWRQDMGMLLRYPKPLLLSIPVFFFVSGILGLFEPALDLGGSSLAEITAGGEFGFFLTDSALGVLLWVAAGCAIIVFIWPEGTRTAIEGTPGAMATVWGWRIPHRILHFISIIVDFAFPTKPPPDEAAEIAPDWLPEDEFDDEELVPEPLPVAVLAEREPEIPDERLSQAELPVNWWSPKSRGRRSG